MKAKEKYLCHQCNCLTDHAAGIAHTIFTRFPYADIYSPRAHLEYGPKNLIPGQEPGKIMICGNGDDQRYVVNMFGQLYPGKPKFPDSQLDGSVARRRYFRSCLQLLASMSDLHSVAFPYGIGCTLAGGAWEEYQSDIETFAKHVAVPVVIYRINE